MSCCGGSGGGSGGALQTTIRIFTKRYKGVGGLENWSNQCDIICG